MITYLSYPPQQSYYILGLLGIRNWYKCCGQKYGLILYSFVQFRPITRIHKKSSVVISHNNRFFFKSFIRYNKFPIRTHKWRPTPRHTSNHHDDVINWKHFPCHWPFARGIHRSPVNSPHKCQWRGALVFSLILAWINSWVNNRDAGDLRRYCAHCDVNVMEYFTHQ